MPTAALAIYYVSLLAIFMMLRTAFPLPVLIAVFALLAAAGTNLLPRRADAR